MIKKIFGRKRLIILAQISLTAMPVSAAEPHVEPTAPKEAAIKLVELSLSKQPATIQLLIKIGAHRTQPFHGAFISNDGLALVNLKCLAWDSLPIVTTWDEAEIKFTSILGIFPEPELALVKFEHRPKVWLSLSKNEPKVGEPLAMVFAHRAGNKSRRKGKTPPVVGPVMARRITTTSPNLKNSFFHSMLSLGSGLTAEQRNQFSPGVFAIDTSGDLVAVSGGLQASARGQTIIKLTPITHLFDEISRLTKGQQAIPRAEVKNHIDTALVDDDYRDFGLTQIAGDKAKARGLLTKLIKKYPQCLSLKNEAIQYDLRDDKGAPIITISDFEPDPESSKAEQAVMLLAKAQFLIIKGDLPRGIEACKKAISLSPGDCPAPSAVLALTYMNSRRIDDARPLLERIHPLMNDSISIAAALEDVMINKGELDEADKLSNRIYELHEIYRR